jgi:hypothetical protein
LAAERLSNSKIVDVNFTSVLFELVQLVGDHTSYDPIVSRRAYRNKVRHFEKLSEVDVVWWITEIGIYFHERSSEHDNEFPHCRDVGRPLNANLKLRLCHFMLRLRFGKMEVQAMETVPRRQTVDLSNYPDLVLVLLGFKVGSLRALPALMRIGRGLQQVQNAYPEGLLRHDVFFYGWNHMGIRQYWRDQPSLLKFTRLPPHQIWWKEFTQDNRGSGFWHEAYSARGGVEAIYIAMANPPGLGTFAPLREAEGPLMSSQARLEADKRARAER